MLCDFAFASQCFVCLVNDGIVNSQYVHYDIVLHTPTVISLPISSDTFGMFSVTYNKYYNGYIPQAKIHGIPLKVRMLFWFALWTIKADLGMSSRHSLWPNSPKGVYSLQYVSAVIQWCAIKSIVTNGQN